MRRTMVAVLLAVLSASTIGALPAAADRSQRAAAAITAADPVLQPWPVLRRGSNSAYRPVTVRSLQYLLNAHGAALAVDGIFGPLTDGSVRSFQRSAGLVVDGIVGPQTWSSLLVTVRRGSSGPAVMAVQDQIDSRFLRDGPPTVAIDGIFGPLTEAWVIAFQQNVGDSNPIADDGIVGPITWKFLITGALSL